MLKNISRFFALFVFSTLLVFAQQAAAWQSYSSKKEIIGISSNNSDQIWCATTGGAFMYEKSTGTYFQLAPSEGLSSTLLTSVAIDNNNQIWFGTQLGAGPGMLNVYDSESGTVRKINDIFISDFTQKAINNIVAVGDTILVSTDFGLALVNSANLSFYDTFLKFGDFEALRPVDAANLFDVFYVLLDDGVAVQKKNSNNLSAPEAWNTFSFSNNISAARGYEFAEYNGSVLLATSSGVFSYNQNSWSPFVFQGKDVHQLAAFGTNLYLVVEENNVQNVYKYDGTSTELVYENSKDYLISDLFISDDQTFYLGTNRGLLEVTENNESLLFPPGPADNAFASLSVDDEGVLWVGTGRDVFGIGAMYFDGSEWRLIDKESSPDLPSNAVHNITVGSDNTKYFCNWGNGVTYYKDGNLTTYNNTNTIIEGIPDAPSFVVITDAEMDSKENVWLLNLQSAGAYPLSMITSDEDVYNFNFTSPSISESELAFHLEIDQFDTKWFAITSGDLGLYYFNENGTYSDQSDDDMGIIRTSDGLLSNSITSLELDHLGTLWVGTNVGVSIIQDPSNPRSRISTVNALRQQSITAITVDALNQKWVATVQGLFHLSQDGFEVFNQYTSENSPIPTNDIKSLSFDGESGTLYIGTDFGLTALKTSSVAPKESMDELFVYPNPVIIEKDASQQITIEGLIEDTSVKVISISGEVLREFVTPGGSIAFWDAKDSNGNFVPSGVYLIVAYDEDGSNVATGKVAVIRK